MIGKGFGFMIATCCLCTTGNATEYTFEQVERELKTRYYMGVPFPIEQEAIDEAVEAFFLFLEESDEVKNHIYFSVNPISRRGETGYVRRDPEERPNGDCKEYFHYHGAILDRYPEFLEEHPVVKDFVEKALPIWLVAQGAVREVLETFEEKYPGICDRFFGHEEPEILVRFLKYNWKNAGKHLARAHYDVGSCTLAISESAPGLRIGSCDEDLTPVTHAQGNAIFMMGKNFPKLTDESFAPSWHDVIQVDETLVGRPYARWAVVCFFEALGLAADSIEETHQVVLTD